jgi:RNA polymerase sigma-70 factor (ECF subfamily)
VGAAELRRRKETTALFEASGYEMPEPVPELLSALRQLSPNQRLAVVLHDYADRPTSEIADTMGCSRATVHVHLSQGRRRLRQQLEVHGD